jgi:hypothetical protein
MYTTFSTHALERVSERLSMRHEELAFVLDEGLALDIGREQKNQRMHRLFYSPGDGQCFVAIQDTDKGTVITVLPIDYHNQICWAVSVGAQKKAKALILDYKTRVNTPPPEEAPPPPKPTPKPKPKPTPTFTVEVFGFNLPSSKRIQLFKWTFEPPVRSIDALIEEEAFARCLITRFAETKKEVFPEEMDWLCIKNRATGEIIGFDPSRVLDESLLLCA